jgi:hypothetical protein
LERVVIVTEERGKRSGTLMSPWRFVVEFEVKSMRASDDNSVPAPAVLRDTHDSIRFHTNPPPADRIHHAAHHPDSSYERPSRVTNDPIGVER